MSSGAVLRAFAATLLLALAACATRPLATGAPPPLSPEQSLQAERAQQAREVAVRGRDSWSLTGRIAVSNGSKGGSGRIEWTQQGDNYQIALSAPVTRQSWRLSGNRAWARLEGLEGGPHEGPDAAQLLQDLTGWQIPVVALADWVRGLRSEVLDSPSIRYGLDLRPAQLQQAGWTILYTWPPTAGADALPSRLDAARGTARVRLIVDAWEVGPERPAEASSVAPDPAAVVELRAQLAQLDLAEPRNDVRKYLAGGDYRFVAVCGFSCSPPGLERSPELFDMFGQRGARKIDRSGDVIYNAEHGRLKEIAQGYAWAYNAALLDWLRQRRD